MQPPAAHPVPASDLVVVAASAGGLAVLHTLVSGLPLEFPAAVAVVHHRTVKHAELLARLLARRSSLRVVDAEQDATIIAGTIYVAPPDKHLTVTRARTIALSGIVIAQSASSAEVPSMPLSAISTGAVDMVVDPESMPAALLMWVMRGSGSGGRDRVAALPRRALRRGGVRPWR